MNNGPLTKTLLASLKSYCRFESTDEMLPVLNNIKSHILNEQEFIQYLIDDVNLEDVIKAFHDSTCNDYLGIEMYL